MGYVTVSAKVKREFDEKFDSFRVPISRVIRRAPEEVRELDIDTWR